MTRMAFAGMLCWVLASCRSPGRLQRGTDDGTVERYRLRGVVVRREAGKPIATIKHGPITNDAGKVWMEAMTMEFPVPNPDEFQLMQEGAMVSAVVVSRSSDMEYWVEQVRVEAPAAAEKQ